MDALYGIFGDKIYFNFLSIGALIVVVFCLVISLFLLNIKDKSRSAVYLGLSYLAMVPFNAPYVFTQIYYDPFGAYHRWFTVPFVLLVLLTFNQFNFHFPTNRNRTVSRAFGIIQSIVAVIGSVYFIHATWNAGKKFYFTGHYWDFDAEGPSRVIAVFIIAYLFIFLGVGIWKIIVTKDRLRWAILLINLGLVLASIVPVFTNLLSRDGVLDRGLHQTITVIAFVVGLFVIFIAYINTTSDKTSFMGKIVGITLVTVLLMIQGLSYVSLADREEEYNSFKLERINRILATGKSLPDEYYSATLDPREEEELVRLDYKRSRDIDIVISDYRAEFLNTAIWEEIALLPEKDFRKRIQELIAGTGPTFDGYRSALVAFLKENQKEDADLKSDVQQYLTKLDKEAFVNTNRIRTLPDSAFRTDLIKYLKNAKGLFIPFAREIEGDLARSTLEGEDLKIEIIQLIAPMKPAGARLYRQGRSNTHYVAFMNFDSKTGVLREVGFSYLEYRKYIHPAAFKMTLILFLILFVILFLYPLFFRGSLINPLNMLLSGVKRVNDGDLNVQVPVKVQDEIGYIAQSFNSMVTSVREAREKLQDYADNLEEKVKIRTAELNKTLEQVQALKTQQDGDYFLTSLLSKPLNFNANKSKLVSTDFILKQKKTFEFRNKKSELGGDICVTGNLRLGKPDNFRRYIVAMNGDAMGKSMQGAGGSLVMGVVINSIMARSAKGNRVLDATPEQWLTDIYNEMHGVFLAFNGSMVISAVVAIIDEETGEMSYFNAEHPYQVLYRNGSASFIEEDLQLRKIGLESEIPFKVRKFQLEPGDVIIVGSDGRDDIDLTPGEDIRTINEDEFLFLKRVEEARGDLSAILEGLMRSGELTDDLSLLRLGFHEKVVSRSSSEEEPQRVVIDIDSEMDGDRELLGNEDFNFHYSEGRKLARSGQHDDALDHLRKAYALRRDVPALNKILAVLTFKEKDYSTAVEILSNYLKHDPYIVDFWLYLSIAHKRTGDFDRAMEAALKVYELNPNRIPNLINLADLYQKRGEYTKAREFIEIALQLDPENRQARSVLAAIN